MPSFINFINGVLTELLLPREHVDGRKGIDFSPFTLAPRTARSHSLPRA